MKCRSISLVLLIISLVSCKWIDKKNICDDLVPSSFSDTCVLWEINPTSNYVFGEVDEYFMWKKYGVILGAKLSLNRSPREDSCFFLKSNQYYTAKYGEQSVEIIVKKVDSLLNCTDRSNIYYFDSVLSEFSGFRDTINKNAKLIDENRYFILQDSLGKTFISTRDVFLYYWYLIDTAGNLENVELINCNCSEENQKKIFETLKVLHWKPAVYQNKKVKWRGKDFLFIKAK